MPSDILAAMRLPSAGWRRDLYLALLLALLAAVFRLPGLEYPEEEYFDEVYHAKAARQYLAGEAPAEWVHPPMAKLLIAVGVRLFGYEPWAWRLMPALAGTLLIVVFFFLARRVLPTERAALLACVLLLADGVYLVQSRIAMTNIFAVLFQLGAALLVVRAVVPERLAVLDMLGVGVLLGLALSTRWTSLWAEGFLGLVVLAVRRKRLFRPRELVLGAVAFALVPAAIYLASYLPLRILRPGLEPWHHFSELLALQREVWSYHANLDATHPYFSKWYTWPWLYRPTWYFFKQADDVVRGIVALGNPALWWVSLPVTAWALVTGIRRRDPRRLFAAVGFCCLYLPWGLAPRKLNYSHYLFEAIPYACLSLGLLLDGAWDGERRELARGYVLLVVFLFFLFLPFLTGMPVPGRLFFAKLGPVGLWTWFRSWI
jgi:dolichyl-phosphate-mannose-protein mannosyltransferase